MAPICRRSGGLVALGYPFGDVVIVFFILVAVRGMTVHDRALWCLLGGLLLMPLLTASSRI